MFKNISIKKQKQKQIYKVIGEIKTRLNSWTTRY